jgi:hypothetical protein
LTYHREMGEVVSPLGAGAGRTMIKSEQQPTRFLLLTCFSIRKPN